jgi:hypothetical protein
MPLKDLTSNNGESFSIDRSLFEKSYVAPVNFSLKQTTKSFFQRRDPAIRNGFIVDGPKSAKQKKWIGGNRDASQTALRRRINTTGSSLMVTGPQSFTNINDRNSRIEALARVRGGGARVPPKVSNRPVTFDPNPPATDFPNYFRIVSAGLNAVTAGYVNWTGSTAYGVSPGCYTYLYDYPYHIDKVIANVATTNTFKRSYNVMTIDRVTGITAFRNYDVFGLSGSGTTNATNMTNYLNALTSSVIVVISTFDEPKTCDGAPLPAGLITAIKRCGATTTFGSANGSPAGFIQYRGAYVLLGIPGLGTGTGYETYCGANNGPTGDPHAVVDMRFSVFNGNIYYISG